MSVPFQDTTNNQIRLGYLTAFLLVLFAYALTFYTTKRLLYFSERVNHTNSIMNTLDNLLSSVKDGETAERGYLIMKDESFLEPFNNYKKRVDSLYNQVKEQTKDNRLQQQQLEELHIYLDEKYKYFNYAILLFRANNKQLSDEIIHKGYFTKLLMDKIRSYIYIMKEEEKVLMNNRTEMFSRFSTSIKVINIVSLLIAVLLAFYSIVTFNKENRLKEAADEKSKALRAQLEERIEELDNLNKELVELRSMEKFAITGRISRTIAHEVRNPLSNINLATEHLKMDLPPDEGNVLLLEMITRNTNRINLLITDLLNSTKTGQLNFSAESINDLLEESITLARDRIELYDVKVIRDYEQSTAKIFIDKEKIRIAFLNILVNAIEAMEPHKGILQIRTEFLQGTCIISISDNGKGMSSEELTKLFEPYFTTKEDGTGLGLTNTYHIIHNHKAKIFAESEIGKGTTFKILFTYL